jgi:hypothetical protein
MKKVYCYFDASVGSPHQGEIIRLWHRSWALKGWDVRMLSPRTLWRSPLLKNLPDWENQLDARRFLSLVKVGGGLLVHYDVINFGLKPSQFQLSFDAVSSGMIFMTGDTARSLRRRFNNKTRFKCLDYVIDFDEPDWSWASLVHFSTPTCAGIPKAQVIDNCGRSIC